MASINSKYKKARMTNVIGAQISERAYNATIGLTLVWGVFINVLMATVFSSQIYSMNYLAILVIYFIGSIGCSTICYRTTSPAVGFIAFSGLAASMGLLLTYFVAYFSGHSVAYAFISTALVTVIMVLLSMLYPSFFLSLGRTLMTSLLVCLGVEILGGLIFGLSLGFVDYVVALIFCGFIGFDWSRAQLYPKTTNNAIISAADIYVDVVNLFIRILEITGRRRD